MDDQETGQWNWMVGRKFSLGEVVDVLGESATVRHGDDETRVLLCELLEEDYKAQDCANRALNEAWWDGGDGAYMKPYAAFRPGDPPPTGYLAWHEWAEVQHMAGLRQMQCGRCGLWRYPQELSSEVETREMRGEAKAVDKAVCLKCAS